MTLLGRRDSLSTVPFRIGPMKKIGRSLRRIEKCEWMYTEPYRKPKMKIPD
jgi:hypothetical protein